MFTSPPVKLTYTRPDDPWLSKLVMQSLEYLTGRGELEKRYQKIIESNPATEAIWSMMVEGLDLHLYYDHAQLNKVQGCEPLVFIANHPFGVVDGVVMGHLVSQISPRFKFLVNAALCKDELLNEFFLPVDFNETKEALQTNLATRARAIDCITQGRPVVIFPSGGVATSPRPWQKAEDLEWKQFVVKLIKKSRATVVPIYFYGQNSTLFQLVSQFSQQLRLSLLLHEVRNKVGTTISFEIGDPIQFRQMEGYDSKTLLSYLNSQVMSLSRLNTPQYKRLERADIKMASEMTTT